MSPQVEPSVTTPVLLEARGVSWAPPGSARRAVGRRRGARASEVVDETGALVVRDVGLSVTGGEFVGLVGPNGAGKSSFMKLALGYLRPSSGEMLIGGSPVTQLTDRERARRVAYMSQHGPDVFPYRVVDIVEMGAWAGTDSVGWQGRGPRDAALEALRFVGLRRLAERPFPTLSGGEQQLALFARVLVQNSPLLLLDEPTASLDIGHESRLLGMVRELTEEGYAAVAALHNLNSAAEYCSRLVMMAEGAIVADGPAEDVITEERVSGTYAAAVHVGRNESTGGITVSARPALAQTGAVRVHLIGGAGSAVSLTRTLHRIGCVVTGGVAHELDSDAVLWRALGIAHVAVPAFADIDSAAVGEAQVLADEADMTILCVFPFGRGNGPNLEIAARAAERGRLRIVADDNLSPTRDFFDEEADQRYRAVIGGAAGPLGWEEILAEVESLRARAAR